MDPYQILNVSKDATDSQIKKAYRELSFKHHPDRNPGADTSAIVKEKQRLRDITKQVDALTLIDELKAL